MLLIQFDLCFGNNLNFNGELDVQFRKRVLIMEKVKYFILDFFQAYRVLIIEKFSIYEKGYL